MYLFVVIPSGWFKKHAADVRLHAFISGVTAAAAGAIAGACVVLARKSIIDLPTAVIASVTLLVLIKIKKVPEPVLIVVAGIIGLFLYKGG